MEKNHYPSYFVRLTSILVLVNFGKFWENSQFKFRIMVT